MRWIAALALFVAGCTSMAVDARTFAGTKWHVVALNGQRTPVSDRFMMSFEADRFSARVGCNSGGGSYRLSNGVIEPGPVYSTQMACGLATDAPGPDPMALERAGFAVLGRPMRLIWQDGTHVTLSNDAGSIALERAP